MSQNGIMYGKTAWITGASSGIGEALVYQFVKEGATVIISSNDIQGLRRVKAACGSGSSRVIIAPFDLADTSDITALVDEQIKNLGKIDYLLNIGGISQRSRVEETPLWLCLLSTVKAKPLPAQ